MPLIALLTVVGLGVEARGSGGAPTQSEELSRAVRSGSKTTYFDLLRLLFPDLKADATAHKSIPLPALSEPRETEAINGDIEFDFKPYWFRSGGERLLLLWVNLRAEGANEGTPFEGEAAVLAVYRLEPKVEMLDALDVKTDRFTGFWEDRPLFRIDSRNDAFVVYSTHWNTGESYLSLDMLFVDAGRIKTIASRFIYYTQGCGVGYTETPYFRAVADPGNKYPRVLVTVRLRKESDAGECDRRTRGYTKYYRGVYRWNPAGRRYETSSRQLDALDKFDERRISSSAAGRTPSAILRRAPRRLAAGA
jgi:hypothetical protein